MKALIFANGKPKDGSMVRAALAAAPDALCIAADGGVTVAEFYERSLQVVIGDMDSIAPDHLQSLNAQGVTIKRYPAEKNETDLELALIYAAEQGANWIRVIGAIGGRFDQMLANVYLLGLPQLMDCDVALVAGSQTICLLTSGTHTLTGTHGDTISLIPISGDVHGIHTQGLKYRLDDETLKFGPARGVSNVMQGQQAHLTISEGMLLCVHTEGKA